MDRPDTLPHPSNPVVTILLASFRGAAFIGTQLDSIARQTHRNWRLIVSDDGSDDGTVAITEAFAASRPRDQVRLVSGPRAGATQNFLHLLSVAPEGMIALCDQDDAWLPDKLERAVRALAPHDGPAHYAARTIIADAALVPIGQSRHFRRRLDFRNALVQAIMAGNTSVFNGPAAALLRRCVGPAQAQDVISHDWWAYQITSGAGAALIHDPKPALLYRQHPQSEMGRNDTISALSQRIAMLLAGDYGGWLARNHAALDAVRSELTPGNRKILDHMGNTIQAAGLSAAQSMAKAGLYRQTPAGTVALYMAALVGRLRQRGPNKLNR